MTPIVGRRHAQRRFLQAQRRGWNTWKAQGPIRAIRTKEDP